MAMKETPEDYLAKLNLVGTRRVWMNNRKTIDYVFCRTRRQLIAKKTACEIGIGEGYLMRKLVRAGLDVIGADVSSYLVDSLTAQFEREGVSARLVCADFGALELAEGSVDLVFCLDVLEHVPDESLMRGLAALAKSIRKGGCLIATVPFRENLDHGMMMCPSCGCRFHRVGHRRAFNSMQDIVNMLSPGFRLVDSFEVPPKLFPVMFVNRLANVLLRCLRFAGRSRGQTTVCFVAEVVSA